MYEGNAGTWTSNAAAEENAAKSVYQGLDEDARDYFMTLTVNSNGKSWFIRRTYRNLRKFDRQLHKCVHDRQFSQLNQLPKLDFNTLSLQNLEVRRGCAPLWSSHFMPLDDRSVLG